MQAIPTSVPTLPTLYQLSAPVFLKQDDFNNPTNPFFYSAFAKKYEKTNQQEAALNCLQQKQPHEIALFPLYEKASPAYTELVTKNIQYVCQYGNLRQKKSIAQHLLRSALDTELSAVDREAYLKQIHDGCVLHGLDLSDLDLCNTKLRKLGLCEIIFAGARDGCAPACANLGWMYLNGLGVKENHEEAFKWVQEAAHQGYASAQDNLGWMYKHGVGVKQDYQLALEYSQAAAKQECAASQVFLGYTHSVGKGVKKTVQRLLNGTKKLLIRAMMMR